MLRALHLLVAIVVAISLLGAGALAASAASPDDVHDDRDATFSNSPTIESDLELPAWLDLGPDVTDASATVHTDVGVAIDGDGAATEARFRQLAVEQQLDGASTEDQEAALHDELSRIDNELTTLRERERTASERYRDGEIDEREYTRTLVTVNQRASAYRPLVATLDAELADTPGMSADRSFRTNQIWLETTQGPVRERATEAIRDSGDTVQLRVAATGTGTSMAMIKHDQYVRETYEGDRLEVGDSIVGLNDILESRDETYPWLVSTDAGWSIDGATFDGSAYVVTSNHRLGPDDALVSFFDGSSAELFYERQRLDLAALPTAQSTTATADGLELQINRTYPGGPAKVEVREQGTNQPADATVAIDDVVVGMTGDDGTLWVVASYGMATVNATVDDRAVQTTTNWTEGEPPENETERIVAHSTDS